MKSDPLRQQGRVRQGTALFLIRIDRASRAENVYTENSKEPEIRKGGSIP